MRPRHDETVTDAFYLRLGVNRYQPTEATESPWDTTAQHGGPPTALLAHVIDATLDPSLRLGRISVDFFGPIPRRLFTVEVTTVKPGRSVHLSAARMIVDGRIAVEARTWHLARGARPPVIDEPLPPPPLPDSTEPLIFAGDQEWGYADAIEWRFVSGHFNRPGPAAVWTRVRIPLVAGESVSGQDRALIAADSANGLSAMLPLPEWFSIPPTMTTTFARMPEGEWIHLNCRTRLAADGIGLGHADLADRKGFVGETTQPLLIRRR
ncbi:MAG: thioesterase family protein [Actinobacteria bacterium]|nr:thioesterase family protein [Actinomycetota bacterium]